MPVWERKTWMDEFVDVFHLTDLMLKIVSWVVGSLVVFVCVFFFNSLLTPCGKFGPPDLGTRSTG